MNRSTSSVPSMQELSNLLMYGVPSVVIDETVPEHLAHIVSARGEDVELRCGSAMMAKVTELAIQRRADIRKDGGE